MGGLKVVHGHENLSSLHGIVHRCPGLDLPSPRRDHDPLSCLDSIAFRIRRVNRCIRFSGIHLSQGLNLSGPRLGVPLGHGSPACEEDKGILMARRLRDRSNLFEEKPGLAVRMEESSVFEQSPFLNGCGRPFREGPLDSSLFLNHVIVPDAGDVAGLPPGDSLQNSEDRLR